MGEREGGREGGREGREMREMYAAIIMSVFISSVLECVVAINSGLFVEVIGLVYTSNLPLSSLQLDSNFESRLPLSEGGRSLQ